MIQGAKKISELTSTTLNGSEIIPVVQDDGLGNLTTFKVLASSLGTDTNLANTNLTQTAATTRTYNMNGNILQFDNGQFVVGNTMGSPYLMEVNGTGEGKRGLNVESSGLIAIRGIDATNVAIWGDSSNGIALLGESSTGSAGTFRGNTYVETSGVGGSMNASAVLEANSTTKGALLPRMTTTQKNAISTPATGLIVFDTTLNRYEFYNGSAWVAYYTAPDGWTTIVKSANQDVTNNATLQDDTELQFSVVAGGHYMIEMQVTYSGNDTSGDYKYALAVLAGSMKGAGTTVYLGSTGAIATTALSANISNRTQEVPCGVAFADFNQLHTITLIYSFTAAANATFCFQFANATAAAGRTSRTWKGSILKYKRID